MDPEALKAGRDVDAAAAAASAVDELGGRLWSALGVVRNRVDDDVAELRTRLSELERLVDKLIPAFGGEGRYRDVRVEGPVRGDALAGVEDGQTGTLICTTENQGWSVLIAWALNALRIGMRR
jgi:hypothetical protein